MSLSSDSRNNAASAVRLTKIGRFFIILVFLLSPLGGPAIGAKADSTISYIGAIGSGTQNVAATLTTTISLSSSTSITAGDAIIIAYTTDAAPDIPLTITNSWSSSDKYQVVNFSVMSAQIRTYIFAAYNVSGLTAGSGNTITIAENLPTSGTQPQNRAAVAAVFRGLAPVGALEQSSNGPANSTAATGTTPSSGSITTVQPVQLLIGAVGTKGDDSANPGTWTEAGWIAGPVGGASGLAQTVSMAYRITASAGSYTASKTIPTARYWGAVIASFRSSTTGSLSYIGEIGTTANTSKTAGTSLPITTNAAVAVGDDIIVAFSADVTTNVPTISDTAGNSWNTIVDVTSAAHVRTTIFQTHVTTALPAGSAAITINHDNLTARSAVVSVFRGLAPSPSKDQTKTASSTTSGTAPSSGASSTTTQADELLIGAVGAEQGNYAAPGTWSNSFSLGPRLGSNPGTTTNGATDITASMGWRIVSATSTYTAQKQGIGSAAWTASLATFKMAAGVTHNLSVSVDPVGGGTTSPSGTTTYAEGAVVNVTASANLGYAFSSWTGACTGSGACSVTMSADKSVTAHFTTVPTYVLTTAVSPSGGGTITPSAGTHTYNQGAVVSVTATPNSGYAFSSWSGACTGSGACSVTMDAAKSVTANFAATTTFTGTELLGRPEATSMSVSIVPNAAITLYYEYGTTSGVYTAQTTQTTAAAATPKVVVISGLTPDTKYYYRMRYSTDGGTTWVARPELSFQTQRATGSTFKFTITTDSHVNIQLGSGTTWQNTLNDIKDDGADFEIDLGDTFAMDNGSASVPLGATATAEQKYKDQLPYFNTISGSSPIYVVPGNHEQQEAWHLTASNTGGDPAISLPVMSKNAEKKYFLNPVNDSFYSGDTGTYTYLSGDQLKQDYFAWTWGDALFVVISPFWTTTTKPYTTSTGGGEGDTTGTDDRWDWTLGQTQFNWLKTTLQNSTAKYKFVFAHQIVGGNSATSQVNYGHGGVDSANLVEWGGYNVGGSVWGWDSNRSGWGSQTIHQILVANGVSAFFHGHDHQYAYEKLDGVVYQAVPSGSFTGSFGMYTTGGNAGKTIWADSTQGPGHLVVTVSPPQTTVDFIRSNASSANTYTIVSVNPTVTISKPGTQPQLDWPAATVDHYAVYRSLTAPYFAPPSAGTKLGNVPTATHSYTDPTAVLTVAGNTYYYVVAPMNASDAPIGASNRTGAFVFGLVPGN